MSSQPTSPQSSLTPYSSAKATLNESKKLQLSQQSRVKYLKTMLDEARMKNEQATMAYEKTMECQDNLEQSHQLLSTIKDRRQREMLAEKEKNGDLKTRNEKARERSKSSLSRTRQANYERERQEYLELKDRQSKQTSEHVQTNQQKRNNVAKQEEERRQRLLEYSCAKEQEFEMERTQDSVEMQHKSERFDNVRQTLAEEENQLLNEIERIRKETTEVQQKLESRQRSRSNSMKGSK